MQRDVKEERKGFLELSTQIEESRIQSQRARHPIQLENRETCMMLTHNYEFFFTYT